MPISKAPSKKQVAILGTRGIPASHGGFETFTEYLAPYLVKHGWEVVVYCQEEGEGDMRFSTYKGVDLVTIPVRGDTPKSTIIFDLIATRHACKHSRLLLTLGYNTGFLAIYCRLMGKYQLINMDGIEWKRAKWSFPIRVWFYFNELFAAWSGNRLIADHPEIKNHLLRRLIGDKVTTIPYGARHIESADETCLEEFGLTRQGYAIVVARGEPENSILEIVSAFSQRTRNLTLVVVGNYDPEHYKYHKQVMQAAGEEVRFIGPVYDADKLAALRYHSLLYIHGHTVGGTNPSLVEALGAGCPVLAHDNRFNRWVTDDAMFYFDSAYECDLQLSSLLDNRDLLQNLSEKSYRIFTCSFEWDSVLERYRDMLSEASQLVTDATESKVRPPVSGIEDEPSRDTHR